MIKGMVMDNERLKNITINKRKKNKKLNITEINRLNVDNNIKYVNVLSNNEIEIIKINGSDKNV